MPNHNSALQSNGVILSPDAKGTKASLMEYKVFNPALRGLTPEEQNILDNRPRDIKQEERDIMTDTSVMYHRDVAYFHSSDADYLRGCGCQDGKRYDHRTGKVWDETIKGTLDRVYKINFIL